MEALTAAIVSGGAVAVGNIAGAFGGVGVVRAIKKKTDTPAENQNEEKEDEDIVEVPDSSHVIDGAKAVEFFTNGFKMSAAEAVRCANDLFEFAKPIQVKEAEEKKAASKKKDDTVKPFKPGKAEEPIITINPESKKKNK